VSWQIEYDPEASSDLRKLDRSIQREILDYMDRRIARATIHASSASRSAGANSGCGDTGCGITASFVSFTTNDWWC